MKSRMSALISALSLFVFTSPAFADGHMASLFVIHGVPDLPEPVDVYVDGDYAFSFDFAETVGPIELPEGSYDLEVQLGGLTILDASAALAAGGNYTVIAHLACDDASCSGDVYPKLTLYDNRISTKDIDRWSTRLAIRHNAVAPEVDVELKRWRWTFLGLPGLSNGERDTVGPVDIPAGRLSATLNVEGTEVFDTGKIRFQRQTSTIIYAVGVFPDSFALIIQPIDLH